MRKLILAATWALMLIPVAGANAQSIEMMLDNCEESGSYCEAFIEGAALVMQVNCQATVLVPEKELHRLAIGWFPNPAAGRHAFLKWAMANSSMWAEPFTHGIILALEDSYPCEW